MNRYLGKFKTVVLLCLTSLTLVGCNNDGDPDSERSVYDDVGELDLELREQLAERPRELSRDRSLSENHAHSVGEWTLDSEEGPGFKTSKINKAPVKRQSASAQQLFRNRGRSRSTTLPAPAPLPAPEYWTEMQPRQYGNAHGEAVGEMELGY